MGVRLGLLLALLAGACGSSDDGGPAPTTGELTYRPCAATARLGNFRAVLGMGFSQVEGQILDGVVPQNVPKEVKSSGDCKLLEQRSLFCASPCDARQTCGDKGTCIPAPVSRSVGMVTASGLKAEVKMAFMNDTYYGMLPHPGFAEGADIRLDATGGELEKFSLRGWGIAPFETAMKEVPVEKGKPVALTWKPPGKQGPVRVHIDLNVNHHGNTSAWIECEAPDTGSFEIPATLVTDLLGKEVTGYPTVTVGRRSADSSAIKQGCVELLVMSEELALDVKIPGLTSCKIGSPDATCPAGLKCQENQTCK